MSANHPAITVAIPTFNGARHVEEALKSALGQQGVAFDLLLVDDRSEDQTIERARVIGGDRLRVVENPERLGLAGNWNRCVGLCSTPYVAILHQDDRFRPGHLESHVAEFERSPTSGLVASASVVIDGSGNPVPVSVVSPGGLGDLNRVFGPGEALPLLAEGNPLRCSAVSIRCQAHCDTGGFDPRLRYVVDWDFWARVSERWSLSWLATPTVDMRWHLESETHRFKTGVADLEETEQVLGGLLGRLAQEKVFQVKRLAETRLARAYLNRAYETLKSGDGPLARRCLTRALELSPGVVMKILADPRLAAGMAAVWAAPGLAGRLARRPPG